MPYVKTPSQIFFRWLDFCPCQTWGFSFKVGFYFFLLSLKCGLTCVLTHVIKKTTKGPEMCLSGSSICSATPKMRVQSPRKSSLKHGGQRIHLLPWISFPHQHVFHQFNSSIKAWGNFILTRHFFKQSSFFMFLFIYLYSVGAGMGYA